MSTTRHALPQSLDALRGLRAARWVRESTPGQFDSFGPDSQRTQQDRAIERYGLIDTGLGWQVAHSGRTVGSTRQFTDMLARAGYDFDILVVGYVSRFVRDLRTAVNARHDLHAAGAAILFADDRLLTSDEDAWEAWAREAVEAEAYSRRLGRRIHEGYAAKRQRLGVPGGNRPPLGTRREGRPPALVLEPETISVVRRAFDLSAGGLTDRQVAAQLRLKLTHLREILLNPFYRGVLRDGSPSALGPLVDAALWDKVQALRGRYARRHRGAVRRRQYALAGLIVCAGCGRRLTGHTGRYRHVDACSAFVAARPRVYQRFNRGLDHRVKGESYKAEWYDAIVGAAFRQVAVNAALVAETMQQALAPTVTQADPMTLARIEHDRDSALARYVRDRDTAALDATMRRLDQDEAQTQDASVPSPTHADVIEYLSNPARLWQETEPERR